MSVSVEDVDDDPESPLAQSFLDYVNNCSRDDEQHESSAVFYDGSCCFVYSQSDTSRNNLVSDDISSGRKTFTKASMVMSSLTSMTALSCFRDIALSELSQGIESIRLYGMSSNNLGCYHFPSINEMCHGHVSSNLNAWIGLCYLHCSELNHYASDLLHILPIFDNTLRSLVARYYELCFPNHYDGDHDSRSSDVGDEDGERVTWLCHFLLSSLTVETTTSTVACRQLLLRLLLRMSIAVRCMDHSNNNNNNNNSNTNNNNNDSNNNDDSSVMEEGYEMMVTVARNEVCYSHPTLSITVYYPHILLNTATTSSLH